MTNPQQPNEWSDPTWQPAPPAPPTAPMSPVQPASGDADGMSGYATPAPQPYQGGPYAGYGQPVVVSQPTNGLAIAALVTAILGFGPIAAIMGHIARKQCQERGEQGDGFALAGIIVGWVTTGIWVLVCCGLAAVYGGLGLAGVAGAQ